MRQRKGSARDWQRIRAGKPITVKWPGSAREEAVRIDAAHVSAVFKGILDHMQVWDAFNYLHSIFSTEAHCWYPDDAAQLAEYYRLMAQLEKRFWHEETK